MVNGVEQHMAIETRYDNRGRDYKTSEPFLAAENPTQWNTKTYDAMNRVVRVDRYNGRYSTNTYQTIGLPDGLTSRVTVRGEDGHVKMTQTNIYGKVDAVYEGLDAGNAYTAVQYVYDTRARLTQVYAAKLSKQCDGFLTRPKRSAPMRCRACRRSVKRKMRSAARPTCSTLIWDY